MYAICIKNIKINKLINILSAKFFFGLFAYFPVPKDNHILFFKRDRKEFYFLSNFFPCNIIIDGEKWLHVEAYYQSQKSHNAAYKKYIKKYNSPVWAKHAGNININPTVKTSKKSWFKKHPDDLREDWHLAKEEVMLKALRAKFEQNNILKHALIKTSNSIIIEDSKNDLYWGIGKNHNGCHEGMNRLGFLLMKVRRELLL